MNGSSGLKIGKRYRDSGGTDWKHACSDCINLISFKRGGKRFYKCLLYGDGGAEDYSSDWNKDYIACKDFNARESFSEDAEIEGQTNIFDFLGDS